MFCIRIFGVVQSFLAEERTVFLAGSGFPDAELA
jgi:hypothetical protein